MRALPSLCRFQVDGMQVESAAKDIIASSDNHGFRAALAFLDLIERQMYRANDGDIDCVAACRTLQRQGRDTIGYGERQRIHLSALLSSFRGSWRLIMPATPRHRKTTCRGLIVGLLTAIARDCLMPHYSPSKNDALLGVYRCPHLAGSQPDAT